MDKESATKTAKVRIITKSEMRYEGELFQINPEKKTISLRQVRSFGTEDREADKPVAMIDSVFDCIIFKSVDIKDLLVLKEEIPKTEGKKVLLKETTSKTIEESDEPLEISEKEEEIKSEQIPKDDIVGPEKEVKEEIKSHKVGHEGQSKKKKQKRKHQGRKAKKQDDQDFDLNDLKIQTETGAIERAKQEEKYIKKEPMYTKDDFFDNMTTSTGKRGRGGDRVYNQMQTNEQTFGMSKQEIQESINEHKKFGRRRNRGNRGKKRPNNQKNIKQGDQRNKGNKQDQREGNQKKSYKGEDRQQKYVKRGYDETGYRDKDHDEDRRYYRKKKRGRREELHYVPKKVANT